MTRFLIRVPGRLSQEPQSDLQDPMLGGPAKVSQLWLRKEWGLFQGFSNF